MILEHYSLQLPVLVRGSKMADTSQQALSEPHTNGVVDGLTEDEKSKMRPADIDADMREMERRKRVEMMMNSRIFREELERIIETQMRDGAGPSGLLQQISDMMGAQGARFNGNVFKNSNCVLPINDIRGVESMGYAKGEKLLRCKMAAVFRLLDLYGWTQGVGGQITARLNQDQEHFLVNPYGLLYHEVTASSLIKVDMQGTIVEQGTTNFGVHITGFQLHSTIHAARPDIKCIIHITTPSVTAVSSLKCGLLPIGQESIVIGEVSTHQYIGGSVEPEEREKIARNLGPINKVMLLTNRGALCCGETVEEAFFNVYNTVVACETQLKLMPAGVDNLSLISEESKKAIFEASRKPPIPQQPSSAVESSALAEKLEKRWRIGGAEFEALMRMLDNAGFRTGYIYRNPLVKGEPPKPRNDVEVPPAVSSLGYLLEEEELYKQGLWKGGRKGTDRSRWLNSPNVYQKVEILETGTPDPKKITKWVSDGSPTHSSTPVKIDGALQFVPKNTNPKEFKQLQQQIKDYRRAEKISAGPQSHILEGVSWEEAKKMQDATISGTGEQVVLVGAASKGIIQRGFQHNAMVYKTPYAKNPFDAVTDQELDQYKREVERKQKGDPYDESQSESEALSSFNISRATHESSTAKSPIQSPVSVTSETEEESRDEPRVLRIETKQVPAPSQPEVVLSDVNDATTEYLNEMRYRMTERQSGYKGDCELASNYSSVSSECARKYYGRRFSEYPYDNPRLENVRASTTAERKKPLLITRMKTLVNGQNEPNAISRDEVFVKSRYEVRRKFFEDLERQKNLETDLTTAKMTSINNKENELILERNSMVSPSENAHLVKLFDVPLTNASTKEHVENLNDETMSNNNVAVHSVAWINIAQPSFVKRVNMDETRPRSLNVMSYINGDSQTDEEIEHPERAKCPTIETVASIKTQSSTTRPDKSIDSTVGTKNEQLQRTMTTTMTTNTEVTLAHSCAETFQRDNGDNEEGLRLLSNLSFNICDGHSIDRYECDDNETLADKEINGELKPTELKKQSVRSWIESSMYEGNSSNNVKTDLYESYNDIAKIVESIDVNITSSRTELDALPDTDTCVKYNLDSTNMSLIYSLTPPAAVDQDESGNDDTSRDLADHSSEWQSDSPRSDNDEPLSDYIWIEPETPTTKAECVKFVQDRRLSSDSSCAELELLESESHSASGSDILELPSCTIRELNDIDGEVFLNGINESANEIIADLNASNEVLPSSDAVEVVQQIIAEIIESIYILLQLDSSIHDLSIVREVVRNLINSYHRECSLMESTIGACMPDVLASSNDNICRIKGFLGNLSSDYDDYDNQNYEMEVREPTDGESPAVIEFCTVAKKLPIVTIDNSALELNFRVIKVSTDEYANMSPSARLRLFGENSIDDNHGIEIGKIRNAESVMKSETWPRCSYCREEEESTRDKMTCLTPISEEPDDALHEVVDSVMPTLKIHDESLEARDIIEEDTTANPARKHISLDDTYTISEVSSVVISDNDEMNDLEEQCNVWDASIDCMSYSYETKEFMRLEKALADKSQLSA
ncbi:Protein hu-li tai shao [Trachymyrmex septentrionalis]|uniref:Protein hu-li tai shao n=1 Tax=Trachymyrmex septentrionalis TaxID=34720 RepID=A0A151JXJ3_9HYME|nr:Protein hu-li tai shao [Trachymyrmex septentrionalis]